MLNSITVFALVFFILTAIYLYWFAGFLAGLFNLRPGVSRKEYRVSVIIPARNEAANIEACLDSLAGQDYPSALYETVVVDDHSTDGTAGLVEKRLGREENLKLVRSGPEQQGKKQAISQGVASSTGEIILVIDADCRAQPTWISGILRYFTPDVGVVAGATFFRPDQEKTLLHKLQALDGLTLIAAGAGSIGTGHPAICNGSNLAYRRQVFGQVNGFEGIDRLESGDDDMFVQKIHKHTSWKVAFAQDPGTYNWTAPIDRPGPLLQQRTRWCSTCAHYPDRGLAAFLIMTYFYYWLTLASIGIIILEPGVRLFLLFLVASKELVQILVLVKGCLLFKRRDLIVFMPLLVAVHMPYVLTVSTLSLFKKYNWKGR